MENNVVGACKTSAGEVYRLLGKLRAIVQPDNQRSLSNWPSQVGGHPGTIVSELKKMVKNSLLRFRVVPPMMIMPSWHHFPFGHAAAQEIETSCLGGHNTDNTRLLDINYCDTMPQLQQEPWAPSLLTLLAIHWASVPAGVRLFVYLEAARDRDRTTFEAGMNGHPAVRKWFKEKNKNKKWTPEWWREHALFTDMLQKERTGPTLT